MNDLPALAVAATPGTCGLGGPILPGTGAPSAIAGP